MGRRAVLCATLKIYAEIMKVERGVGMNDIRARRVRDAAQKM